MDLDCPCCGSAVTGPPALLGPDRLHGTGGRFAYDFVTHETTWRGAVDEALRQALVNLDSRPAPGCSAFAA